MKEQRKVPQIRFKGFTNDWEQRKLKDISSYRRGSFPQPYGKEEWYGGSQAMPFVQVADVNDDLKLNEETKQTISKLAQPMSVYIPKESVIVTLQGTIGKVAITQYNTYLDRTILYFDTYKIGNINKYFWALTIKNKFEEERKKAPGAVIKTITKEVLSEFNLNIPQHDEQEKIGMLFANIDNLITLHQRKCDKLVEVKNSLLEKMFPKNSSKIPEIRFKGFTDDWEQRKLSEFVDKAVDNRGKTPPLDENGTHPLIEVSALGGVHPDYSKVEKCLNDDSFENSLRAYIKEGDILFTTVGSIGLVSLMDSREEAAIAQNIVAFRAKENFVPEYLYALFSNEENQYKATRIVMGAVQPSIKVSQLVDVEYMLTPNVKEQKKIGAYFSSIDNLITLHQRKLEKLKEVKKSMLEKMFV